MKKMLVTLVAIPLIAGTSPLAAHAGGVHVHAGETLVFLAGVLVATALVAARFVRTRAADKANRH